MADQILEKLKAIISKVTEEESKEIKELKELDNDAKGITPTIVKIDRKKFIKGIQPIKYFKYLLCCVGGFPALIELYENNKDFKIVDIGISQNDKMIPITFKALNTNAMKMIKDRYIQSRLSVLTLDMMPIYTKNEQELYKDREPGKWPMNHLLSNLTLLNSYVPHKKDPVFAQCWSCKKVKGDKLCESCRTARYCSKECQKNDWYKHKKVCRPEKK